MINALSYLKLNGDRSSSKGEIFGRTGQKSKGRGINKFYIQYSWSGNICPKSKTNDDRI